MHPDSPTDLHIADWRRRISELYAEVRHTAETDPEAAHHVWRTTRERLYREHPASPVRPEDRGTFAARHWPYERALRFEAGLIRPAVAAASEASGAAASGSFQLPASLPIGSAFTRIGHVEIPFREGARRLSVFWLDEYSGGLFLPFRDGTSGRETYGAGRYLLDTAKGADLGVAPSGALILDFNFAFQPSCAFDPRWACPLAPPENRLDLPVYAGERLD